ncbi:hypothetical protein AN958_00101 [Leucoagaricus sp. SymC.cos]|nr:hypothetical protein AN958_00101 [Leucoagaricus sp. SymC.cos]
MPVPLTPTIAAFANTSHWHDSAAAAGGGRRVDLEWKPWCYNFQRRQISCPATLEQESSTSASKRLVLWRSNVVPNSSRNPSPNSHRDLVSQGHTVGSKNMQVALRVTSQSFRNFNMEDNEAASRLTGSHTIFRTNNG